jgi:glycine cleavage system H protein
MLASMHLGDTMNGAPLHFSAPGAIRIPTDRLYTRTHLWILPQADKPRHVRVGLTAYACRYGIEIYFIEDLPAAGTVVNVGDKIGRIETEKAAGDVHSPLAGSVVAVNEAVLADPSIITFDGYGAGWIVEIQGDIGEQLTAAEYVAYLETLPLPQCYVKE